MACPWAATEAAGRCGTPAHRPHHPDIQTGDCPDIHDTVHIPYTPAPTLCHPPVETLWAPSWPEEVKLDVRRAGELSPLSQLANSTSDSSVEKQSNTSNPERVKTASCFIYTQVSVGKENKEKLKLTSGILFLAHAGWTGNDMDPLNSNNMGRGLQLYPFHEFPPQQQSEYG